MANIVDRRRSDTNKSAENRKRFISRYKYYLIDSLNKSVSRGSITKTSNHKVSLPKSLIREPSFSANKRTGDSLSIHPGNKHYTRHDRVPKPQEGSGAVGGSGGEVGEDDFSFVLTKDEFLDLYFENMELPNFIKKSTKSIISSVNQRAGYRKDGNPSQIVLKKTFENAIARRIATRSANPEKKPAFLDEIDLRYRNTIKVPKPDRHATMFCVLDVSGSMTENDKLLAKKFFMLLHLFLTTLYKTIDIKFIRYHHEASLTDEHTFFYSRETGGTTVSKAIQLINETIDTGCVPDSNIYIAQVSDGDTDSTDSTELKGQIATLLPKIQYMAYVNLLGYNRRANPRDLSTIYNSIGNEKLQSRYAAISGDIKNVLQDLFKKGGAK